ncbi:MAG: glycine cleavage system protein GcvH [Candidatus Marinimicrobia bacterium]|jgi:glycine cleavage system H protein|nr:glycine cleavage system protein GcvH [Candidatus Neomarinimicrobiota bacterium]HJM47401.1 glycine cleavage system protein GcvH [Candidatus Neomarinimicrobiota bacterium]
MNITDSLLYTDDHEWIKIEDSQAIIGITDFAQSELGDIVFIEFPDEGNTFQKGDTIGTIEAVKTVADLYAPVSGKILELNLELDDNVELINSDPIGKGWLIKMELFNPDEISDLLSAEDYRNLIS